MQECRCRDLLYVPKGDPRLFRDNSCILCNALRMPGCIRVPSFDILDHQLEKFSPALLQSKILHVYVTNYEERDGQGHNSE